MLRLLGLQRKKKKSLCRASWRTQQPYRCICGLEQRKAETHWHQRGKQTVKENYKARQARESAPFTHSEGLCQAFWDTCIFLSRKAVCPLHFYPGLHFLYKHSQHNLLHLPKDNHFPWRLDFHRLLFRWKFATRKYSLQDRNHENRD